MARTLFFRMLLRKFSEITNNKLIFSHYDIFYYYKYFFFHSASWFFFNHRQKSQSKQEQCSLCCTSPCFLVLLYTHYGPLKCFSTYFCKLKEIGVLRPIFPDCVISCNYDLGFSTMRQYKNVNEQQSLEQCHGNINKCHMWKYWFQSVMWWSRGFNYLKFLVT